MIRLMSMTASAQSKKNQKQQREHREPNAKHHDRGRSKVRSKMRQIPICVWFSNHLFNLLEQKVGKCKQAQRFFKARAVANNAMLQICDHRSGNSPASIQSIPGQAGANTSIAAWQIAVCGFSPARWFPPAPARRANAPLLP